MMRTHLGLLGCVLGTISACASGEDDYALDVTELADGASLDGLDLRIDVVPPDAFRADPNTDSLGPPGALPQTFEFQLSHDLELTLLEAITVRGSVSGYVAAPWAFDVPGTIEALAGAAISLRLPNSVQSANTLTGRAPDDVVGSFALRLPPGAGYRLAVVPNSALIAPYDTTFDVTGDSPLTLELPLSAPVWGRVLDPDGAPLVGARVYGTNPNAVSTASSLTDAGGWWLVRVPPATWTFVCEGRDNGRDPSLFVGGVEVDAEGTTLDFEYPALALGTLTGRAIDASGDGVQGAIARLRASALDGYSGVQFTASKDVRTDADGVFTAVLVPGTWHVELLPPDTSGLGPVVLGDVAVARADVADVADVHLPPTVAMVGVVADGDGLTVPGAVVSATEIGFGGRSWTAITDTTGAFKLSVPNVPLAVEILPPGDRSELALTRVTVAAPADELLQFGLSPGIRVAGRVVFESPDEPVPFAVLEVRDATGRRWATGLTGPDGRFEIQIPRP